MVICPSCGGFAVPSNTQWGVRHDCCGLHSWNNAPLKSAEYYKAKCDAHDAFDPLWKDGLMTRSAAYKLLADKLEIHVSKCHMKTMSLETALKVPAAVIEIQTAKAKGE